MAGLIKGPARDLRTLPALDSCVPAVPAKAAGVNTHAHTHNRRATPGCQAVISFQETRTALNRAFVWSNALREDASKPLKSSREFTF